MNYQKDLAKYYQSPNAITSSWIRYSPPFTDVQILVLVIVIVVLFMLLFTVGILTVWQTYYLFSNLTTIEDFENRKIDDLKKQGVISKDREFPYDLGTFKNISSLFGSNWFFWCLPLNPVCDGFVYETNDKDQMSWPPREYYLHKKYPNGKPSKAHKEQRKDLKRNPLVRRGSEGYLCKQLTAEDREKMVNGTYKYPTEPEEEIVSSTDFDSLDDDSSDEQEKVEEMLSENEPLSEYVLKRKNKVQ